VRGSELQSTDLFFAGCGPEYTRLDHNVSETLQFAKQFSDVGVRYLFTF